jgi:hypothetical protein
MATTNNACNTPQLTTNGQLLIGAAGLHPVAGNLTSLDSSISMTNGAGTIDLSAVKRGFNFVQTLSPSAGSIIFDLTDPRLRTYQYIFLTSTGIFPAVSQAVYMLLSLDGINYLTTNYMSGTNYWNYNSATWSNTNSSTRMLLSPYVHQSGQAFGLNMQIYCSTQLPGGPTPSGFSVNGSCQYGDSAANNWTQVAISGIRYTTAAVQKIKITSDNGLIGFGQISIYGVQG